MQKRIYWLFLFSLLNTIVFSQNITTTVRGTVQDALTQQPLFGATVEVFNIQHSAGNTTDSLGNFTIRNIPVGRYEVEISYLGYETLVLTETLLESGKEKILSINLPESFSELQQVVVKSTTQNANISPLSNHEITIEEVKRFPATFFDPARLAMLYPGVTGTNDQANGLSIRGLPPSLLQWRLEGVEIVNPNHLSNAGTISDQPSVAAGGVNILSAQMLDNSRLYTGALPAQYSNALGGVMDMRLRKGNDEQHEFTAQAGLLGFDLGMEGPFSKKSKASFLFNYRYSFTGLLTNFGVDFDGESIGFEDVSFNINLPTKKLGKFMFFGIGGMSDNFKKALPIGEREVEKDQNQIDFKSKIGIGGVKHQFNFRNIFVETVVAYSGLKDERRQERVNTFEEIGLQKEKLSINHKWRLIASEKSNFVFGLQYLKNRFENSFVRESFFFTPKEGRNDTSYGGFFSYKDVWWKKMVFNIGFNVMIRRSTNFVDNQEGEIRPNSVNPHFSLTIPIDKKAKISYYLGVNDGLFPIVFRSRNNVINHSSSRSYSIQQSINYELFYENKVRIKAEFFHQTLHGIPTVRTTFVSTGTSRTDHLTNENSTPFSFLDRTNGKHRSIGFEFLCQQYFTGNSYTLFSGTFYQAKYATFSDYDFNAKYSGDFIINGVWGREFTKQKTNKINTFGLNIRGVLRGGFRERISENGSTSTTYDERLPPYFRIDLRFYLRKNKPNRTSTLSLDVQNATNQQNIAYRYFDNFTNKVETQYQLGLIPLINYRIEF